MQEMAEQAGVPVSEMWRRAGWLAVEGNQETLTATAEIEAMREDIKHENRANYYIEGFGGRVRSQLEDAFFGHFTPDGLSAIADGAYQEAEGLEEISQRYDHLPTKEDGELQDVVDDVLAETLEAADLTNWYDRYDNQFERFDSVESGKRERQVYVNLVQRGVEVRESLQETFKSGSPKVRAKHLPEQCEDDLPPSIDRDDVAAAANELWARDVDVEDVPDALEERDPDVWDPTVDAADDGDHDGDDEVEASDETESPSSSDDVDDPADDGPQTGTRYGLIAWAAKEIREAETPDSGEASVRRTLTGRTLNGKMATMNQENLSPNEVIELAHEHNEQRAASATDPGADAASVAATDGGTQR